MGRKNAEYSILNYVEDNQASLNEQGFNEIDGLVLSQVANMHLENSGIDLYSGNSKSFKEIYDEMQRPNSAAHDAWQSMGKNDRALLERLASSDRYAGMSISNFVLDPSKNEIPGFSSVGADQHMEQFAAATITYEQNGEIINFVSYRATDGSTDGWAEDAAMLYSMNTQAQSDSVAYMNIIAGQTQGYIDGGGHSKGGGDFEYAYLFCNEEAYSRLRKGYVYDSPGLTDEVLANTGRYGDYLRATDGSYICPQDSIIGQVLHEGGNATFIHSVESGFNEHDPYSWSIQKNGDTYTFEPDEQSELSKFINSALDNAVGNMSQEEREAFFVFLSYLLYNNGGDGIDGLMDLFGEGWKTEDGKFNFDKLKEVWNVISDDWDNMTPEQRKAFIESLGSILAGIIATSYEYAKEAFEEWVEKKKEQIKQAIHDAWVAVVDWVNDKKEKFLNFLDKVYDSFVINIGKFTAWVKSLSAGSKYANNNPIIKVDTYKLTTYAGRLQAVNRRLSALDTRIDKLYWRVGLLDLWNLMRSDFRIGYSSRINSCANYLNNTASDFNNAEQSIVNNL